MGEFEDEFQLILALILKLIFKSPRFVPIEANLAQLESQYDISEVT